MTNVILNEKAYAEQAINSLTLGNSPIETLSRVARYYYSEGYKKKEISGLLEDFMLKCDPSTNIVKWQNIIDRLARASDKYELIDVPGVFITKSEMRSIKSIDGKLLQRLMFTMLCLSKYGNLVSELNNNWVNRDDKDIFGLANIKVTSQRQSLMINDLWKMNLIGFSRVVDNININVKIVDDESPVELFIGDFRNLGNQYMKYCGEKYIECQCCGKVVKKNNGKQKYCHDCAVEIDRAKARERRRIALS